MKIEVLFPEICNLYGDLANVTYLARCLGDAEIVHTSLKDIPLFSKEVPDLIFMGSTTERGQELAIEALLPYKKRIEELIDSKAVFLITGNAVEIFAQSIEDDRGRKISGLNLFPVRAQCCMMNRYNSLYLGKFNDMDIVGFKSQFGHLYGDCAEEGLFQTVRGAGRNPEEKKEGFRKNNFMATYLIGPLLVLNPDFTKYLMKLMGSESTDLVFEEAIYDVYNRRLSEFKEPDRGFGY